MTPVGSLPPTIADRHVHISLIWPTRGRVAAFIVDGDLAVDAMAVIDILGIDAEAAFTQYPYTWWHEYSPPPLRMLCTIFLWTREQALAAALALAPSVELAKAFGQWLRVTHDELCVVDLQGTIENALPPVPTADGTLLTVELAARKIMARMGGHVSRTSLFQRMESLGWVTRDRDVAGHGFWKPSLDARAARMVVSREVALPKGQGSYQQVFLTADGMTVLSAELRTELAPTLFEGDDQ